MVETAMSQAMAGAFAKVGLSPSAVAFAAACHDAARMALNRADGDPKRATAVWLNIAGGLGFRGPLEQFIAAVAEERRATKSDGGAIPAVPQGHFRSAPLSEPNAGEVTGGVPKGQAHGAEPATSSEGEATIGVPRGQPAFASPSVPDVGGKAKLFVPQGRATDAASSTPDAAAGAIVAVPQGQSISAPIAAPKPPAASTVRGIVHAKEMSARVMSGIQISDRGGRLIELDTLPVSGLDYRLKAQGRRAAKGAVDYNTLYLVKQQVERQAFVPTKAVVGDVLDAGELRHLHELARAFASSPMVQLPEALRQEVMAA